MTSTLPPRSTKPLPDSAGSLFDRYAGVFKLIWRIAFGYALEQWQEDALRIITELRADGRLRHRQFLVSMGRQNGKTELAAALGILFMLWKAHGYIIGIASSAEQARLVYDRVMRVIRANGSLAAKFTALTDTRGIRTKAGGKYEIKAAKSATLQGIPVDLAIVDEVHLVKMALWNDLVNGLGSRPDCMVVGITTAGDDTSELLKHLYALADSGEIGALIWEAPEARIPEDDDTLWEYLLAANPSLAAGEREIEREAVIKDVRSMTPDAAIRYRLNRFTADINAYMTLGIWTPLARHLEPQSSGVVFSIDRTPQWTWATVTANWLAADDKIATAVVASIASPNSDKLVGVCQELAPRHRLFVGDGYGLGPIMEELKTRGLATKKTTLGDETAAASRLYARVHAGTIEHAGDPLLTAQIPHVKTKSQGDHYRLIREAKDHDIDAVVSTARGVYFAEMAHDVGSQLFT